MEMAAHITIVMH